MTQGIKGLEDSINDKLDGIQDYINNSDHEISPEINNLEFYLKGILNYEKKTKDHLEKILNEVDSITFEELKENNKLCETIKKSNLFYNWLNTHFQYFENEDTSYNFKRTYKRREIIKVDLGFNVGSELGGLHYCVVVEKDDNMSDSTLVVVPLSTFRKKGRKVSDLYPTEVDLGVIGDLIENSEEIYSYALIDQIRLISKLRIHEPRSNKSLPARLSDDQMDLIDEKIIHFFSNKNIAPMDPFDELDKIIYKYAEYKKLGEKYEEHLRDNIHILHEKIFNQK